VAEWIVAPALAASRDLPVRLTEGPGLASFRAMQGQRPVGGGIEQLGLGWLGKTVQFPASTQSVVDIVSAPVFPCGARSQSARAPWAV
jgi:hypothetical protein